MGKAKLVFTPVGLHRTLGLPKNLRITAVKYDPDPALIQILVESDELPETLDGCESAILDRVVDAFSPILPAVALMRAREQAEQSLRAIRGEMERLTS